MLLSTLQVEAGRMVAALIGTPEPVGVFGYHPEMGGKCPEHVTTHATLAHYGKHYFLRSTLGPDVIRGRGVEYDGVSTAEQLVPGSKFVGYHNYKVTIRAYEQLKKRTAIGLEILLD